MATPAPGRRRGAAALVGTPIGPAGALLERLERGGVRTRVTVRGPVGEVPPQTGSAALLVVQQALQDAADDGAVDVRVRQEDDELAVTVYSLPREGRRVAVDRPRLADCAVREPVAAARGTVVSRETAAGWIVTARFPTDVPAAV